jgi:hypothetical protein
VTVSELLRDLASRVERNVPRHRDPEQFHIEKSEIACELRRLAKRDTPRHLKPTTTST